MKNKFFSLIIVAFIGVAGCTVKVAPSLDSSLGMDAFENMRQINMRDVSLALYLDPKLKNLNVEQKIRMGEFSFDIGRAFSAKLVKALAYNFRTIHIIDTLSYSGPEPVDALMRVSLQDMDVNMAMRTGFATISTEAYSRLSIRAEIQDAQENRTIWVGTTQAKEEGGSQEMGQMTYQEAGRGFASTMSSAIDKAIGDLLGQMNKSSNLHNYLAKWEQKNNGMPCAQR
ncbi:MULTISPECIES: hypothetical protein [Nitrosococcus]|uniref:Lipoprotein n=3 Tax=Nitrosococcus TaxID=1227 RepID=Q3JF71_NITOC|nr:MULTISPECIES: hypothetical protein [Nitrosococcus]KFI17791.1 hypothetical protein IB75_18710 [Nitrosococcus oceani C-27]ABA56525.1 hypothetical protein Noc_A0012 [Nitrosococcus oceani ATCC 19707]ADJ29896.1 conserved hypothetical protein [Nitrosococcus watsonii C-113]EDZ65218.1 hypothetical protein NOC27_3382 [Nitrosococcus oceani AFC27]BBM60800.1 hypothetical protein NONS58_P0140 [Nitrosococcus oceani]